MTTSRSGGVRTTSAVEWVAVAQRPRARRPQPVDRRAARPVAVRATPTTPGARSTRRTTAFAAGRPVRPATGRRSSCGPRRSSTAPAREVLDLLAAETGCGPALRRRTDRPSACRCCARRPACRTRRPGRSCRPTVPGSRALAVRRPVGVVAAIAPWNAALVLAGRAVVGPLALGNTVVLKPSEESPITGGTLWAEIFAEAGPAARRAQRRHPRPRRRRRDRRGTGHPPAGPADQLHRLDGHRATAGRAGRPATSSGRCCS